MDIIKFIKIANCQGNFYSLDFKSNYEIIEKCLISAKENNCSICVFPEFCITGPNCEDHFYEKDTVLHSWEIIGKIIESKLSENLLIILNLPIIYEEKLFNCLIPIFNNEILFLQPKCEVIKSVSNYENRWFSLKKHTAKMPIKLVTQKINDKNYNIKFGNNCIIEFQNSLKISINFENELNKNLYCDFNIICASKYYEFSKNLYEHNFEIYKKISEENKNIIIFSNLLGCGGSRLYYPGGSFIMKNGKFLLKSQLFSLQKFDISFLNILLEKPIIFPIKPITENYEIIKINLNLNGNYEKNNFIELPLYKNYEEIMLATTCYIFDYLKKSKGIGFFIRISKNSIKNAYILIVLINLLSERLFCEFMRKNENVIFELKRISNNSAYTPTRSKNITKLLLYTCFMGNSVLHKEDAKINEEICKKLNSNHINYDFSAPYNSIYETVKKFYQTYEIAENLKENCKISEIYLETLFAYLLPVIQSIKTKRAGFLLVLSNFSNSDYIKNPDLCFTGDFSPLCSWTEEMKNIFCQGFNKDFDENLKISYEKCLSDKYELSKKEIDFMINLWINEKCGPVSMFEKLLGLWESYNAKEIGEKVKLFFKNYAKNRLILNCIPQGPHLSNLNLEDKRTNLRQILYEKTWEYQFDCIDKIIN